MKQHKANKTKAMNAKPTVPTKPPVPKGFKHDKDLLLSVFAIQNPSRNRACNDHAMDVITSLAPPDCTVIRNRGNLLIRKGPASGPHPYFISHMDQVHDYVPFMQVLLTGNLLHAVDGNGDRCGVGGDDKCGIYLALRMLHVLPHVTAVFVRDEEVGCLGSNIVPLQWFDHASFVLQADRNNRTMDVIRDTNAMECASDDFMDCILSLPICKAAGHKENTGSITDIGELASRGLPVSMVNISSGYHGPHTANEVVHLDELSVALQLAYEAATEMGGKRWDHDPSSSWYGSHKYGAWGSSGYESASYKDVLDYGVTAPQHKPTIPDEGSPHREAVIAELVFDFGHDREFDCLDEFTTSELEMWVDDCRTARCNGSSGGAGQDGLDLY